MEEDFEQEQISKVKTKYTIYIILIACITAFVSSYITYSYIVNRTEKSFLSAVENGKEALNFDNIKPVDSKGTGNNSVNAENNNLSSTESTAIIGKTLKTFRDTIDKFYIGEVDESKMLDNTIKGYIEGLEDEYSEYMTKEEWEDYQANALGNYVGVGIYMSMDKNDNIVVVSPIKGTPAEEAGVQPGDIIAQIGEESTVGMDSNEASAKIKGEPGTKVDLKLIRNNEYVDVTLERKEIKVYHVESEMLEDNIGYIQLLTFDTGCADEVKKAYEDLQSKGAKKIVFDLRNNTGGLVDEALEIADYMIAKDKNVLITVDANDNKKYNKSENDPIMDCPIVVLVNEYSASASEILTGALKDNDEAEIVGTTTYGKGVIQNVFQLTDGSVLKLTVAEYYTPNENKINKVGIEPDHIIEDVEQEDGQEEIDEQLNKAIEIIKSK